MRLFKTGATRNTDDDKLDFEAFLSPLVLQKFAEYMQTHRKQADGKLREGDNWQKKFGENHYEVCMKSLWRHFQDLWLEHRGFKSREGIESAMMGIIFNIQAYAYKYYTDQLDAKIKK